MNNLRRKRISKLVEILFELRKEFDSIAVGAEEYVLDYLSDALYSFDEAIETLSYLIEN